MGKGPADEPLTMARRVWVVDDDQGIRWVLRKALEQAGFAVTEFAGGSGVIERVRQEPPALILTDIRMPDVDGMTLLGQLREAVPQVPVVITTAYANLDSAVSSYREGAYEYLPKPFDVDDAVALVQRALAAGGANVAGQDASPPPGMIGQSPAMQVVFRTIGRLSRSAIGVLITGETGTGKELVARALHENSPRADGPFVALNVAAISRDLLESELFGHERGAFTGAQSRRIGRFAQAEGGTLFLDEIGDMPAELQTRLLRVLAEGEYYPVGGQAPQRSDVRVLAATHQDLGARVASGDFRQDLFHRLNIVSIEVPPLRERRDDIPALATLFLRRAAAQLQTPAKSFSTAAMDYLVTLPWPGNVRQLENLCLRLTAMTAASTIDLPDLSVEVAADSAAVVTGSAEWDEALAGFLARRLGSGQRVPVADLVARLETIALRAALAASGGHKQDAARLLGWGRNTLTRKLRDLDVEAAGNAAGEGSAAGGRE